MQLMKGYEYSLLRALGEVQELDARPGPVEAHVDPSLNKRRRVNLRRVRRLLKAGLARVSRSCQSDVGLYPLGKGNGKQRMIWDSSLANRIVLEPPGVSLLTAEGMGRFEDDANDDMPELIADEDEAELAIGITDGKVCFQRLKFGETLTGNGLSEFYGHPKVAAGEMGVSEVKRVAVTPNTPLWPLATSLPMRWTWSLFFCQYANSGLMPQDRFRRASTCSPAGGRFSCGAEERSTRMSTISVPWGWSWRITEATNHMVDILTEVGLEDHEAPVTAVDQDTLGMQVACRCRESGCSLARYWEIRLGLRGFLQLARVSGLEVEAILGHIT